jgi:hypothetical protein
MKDLVDALNRMNTLGARPEDVESVFRAGDEVARELMDVWRSEDGPPVPGCDGWFWEANGGHLLATVWYLEGSPAKRDHYDRYRLGALERAAESAAHTLHAENESQESPGENSG